jgi:small subunit ribosomal protein S8e
MKRKRKITGKKYVKSRKKKSFEHTNQKRTVKLGEENKRIRKVLGGNKKTVLLNANQINIKKGNKTQKVIIKNVLKTPSNRFFARQNILTKGTIVETDLGKAKITNRPSQDGSVNGILIE